MFPFHPEFFEIKREGEQEAFRADIGLSPGEETPESKVVSEQTKSALHLDGAAKAQMDSTRGGYVLFGLLPFLPKGLLQDEFLWFVLVLRPAALAAARVHGHR